MSEKKPVSQQAEDHVWFAFFICLIGLTLLLTAYSDLTWQKLGSGPRGDSEPNFWTVGGLVLAALGTMLLFAGMHSLCYDRIARSLRVRQRSWTLRKRKALFFSSVLGTSFLVAAGFLLWKGVTEVQIPALPEARQFALAIPLGERAPQQGQESSRPTSTVASAANGRSPEGVRPGGSDTGRPTEAVLFWTVPPQTPSRIPGLLSMTLAAVLTVCFGFVYPAIARSGDEEGRGLVGKLVVPALSFVLFGIGASQAASAETNRQNVQLASQALEPVAGVAPSDMRIRALRAGEEPAATSRHLETALADLQAQMQALSNREQTAGMTSGDRTWVEQELAALRETMSRPVIDPSGPAQRVELRRYLQESFRQSQRDTRYLSWLMQKSQEALRGDIAAREYENRRQLCIIIQAQIRALEAQRGMTVALLERQDRLNLFRQAWLALSGQARRRAEAYRAQFGREAVNELARQLDEGASCDEAAPLARPSDPAASSTSR